MAKVYVVHKADGPVACMLGPKMGGGLLDFCKGCQAYEPTDVQLCLSVDVDCCQNGHEVLAEIKVHVGTRFTGETLNGRIIEDALVVGIVEWREYPLQVHWTDSTGKHIEPFALHEFKHFKFL